ncbi:MAG: enoyl-CoA hydratase-related protein, partial [Parvularculaceae bacterium]
MPKDVKKVRVSIDGQIATVTIDNPPVNALSQAVRAGLLDAFDALARESSVEAIVLCCAGRSFIVGADISEFGKPSADPQLPDVVDRIEQIDRPVIAALHGAALGGGFEIALGCHYRLAAPGTKVGLPEVTLGLIPGAGACYRLPRLVGVADALSMIAGGAPIDLETAVKRGAIDLVVAGDLTEAAKAYAAQLIESRSGVRRLCDDDGKIITFDRSVFLRQKMALKPAKRGQIAPDRAVDAVELGVTLPLAQAR